jgi:hypothetical protein
VDPDPDSDPEHCKILLKIRRTILGVPFRLVFLTARAIGTQKILKIHKIHLLLYFRLLL